MIIIQANGAEGELEEKKTPTQYKDKQKQERKKEQ